METENEGGRGEVVVAIAGQRSRGGDPELVVEEERLRRRSSLLSPPVQGTRPVDLLLGFMDR